MRSTLPLCRPVGAGSEALSSERPRTPASVFACAAPLPFVLLRSSSSSSFSSFSSTLRGRMRSSTARLLSALLAVRPCVHIRERRRCHTRWGVASRREGKVCGPPSPRAATLWPGGSVQMQTSSYSFRGRRAWPRRLVHT